MKFKSIVFSFFLVLGLTTSAWSSDAKSKLEYWQETGLSFGTLSGLVNNTVCNNDQQVFIACIQAINDLLASDGKRVAIVARSRLASNPKLGKLIKSFGALQIVELSAQETPEKESLGKRLERQRKERAEIQESLLAVYRGKSKTNFNALLDWARKSAPAVTGETSASVIASAINVFLSVAFDPHTYITPKAYNEAQMNSTTESFVGIGAILHAVDGQVVVQRPIENSPAFFAGLRAKDVITYVDDAPVAGLPLDQVVAMLRGLEGTKVSVSVERATTGQSVRIEIVRAPIVTENVEYKLIADRGRFLGYVRLRTFMEMDGCQKVEKAIRELEASGAQGIIFDLRDNGGGLVNQAVCITGLFVGPNKVALEMKSLRSGVATEKYMTRNQRVTSLPLVTLINSHSASASEIVSGALQDHQRGIVLGIRSFGKGSVQMAETFRSNRKIQLWGTVARFYLPSGRTNQIVGVLPDIEVYGKPFPTDEERIHLREEDRYENALPPVGPTWVQPRPLEMDRIYECMMGTGFALYHYQADEAGAAIPPDYQLLSAQDALQCM